MIVMRCLPFRYRRAVLALLAVAPLFFPHAPALAQAEEAELLDRLQRLEAQMRAMNGRIEELQFRNRELESQLKRFQSDAEFRFGELEKSRGAGGAAAPRQVPTTPTNPQQTPQRRSDAFDPSTQPGTTGAAPRDLGSMPATPPAGSARAGGGNGPLNLSTLTQNAANDPSLEPRPPQGSTPAATVASAAAANAAMSGSTPQIMATSPKDEYDQAVAMLGRKEYEAAEQALRGFVQKHPRSTLVGDAHYQIGETYYQRRQYRDAASAFLKVSTDFPKSSRAASSLLRLGQSLYAISERDTACSAYAQLERKYPKASPSILQAAKSEQVRARC